MSNEESSKADEGQSRLTVGLERIVDKAEFMRQWAVSGMSMDKIKLANAAWDAAAKAEREACAMVCDALCNDDNESGHNECDGGAEAAARIRMRSNAELRDAKPIGEASRSNSVLGGE